MANSDGETKGRGGREIDDEFELGRLHDREIGGFRALQDAADIDAGLAVRVGHARSIAHQPAGFGVETLASDRGESVPCRQVRDLDAPVDKERAAADEQGVRPLVRQRREGSIDFDDGAGVENADL